jgi:hypothetical protein
MAQLKPRNLRGIVKESETKRQAIALLSVDTPIEVVLEFLRERGFNKIDSINFLTLYAGLQLSEAKEVIHLSETWSDRLVVDEQLHDRLEEAAKLAGFVVVPSSKRNDD